MTHLRKDDEVIVISGNHRGMSGKIIRKLGERVVIQGLNVRKKHVKPSQQNPKGSIISLERPIHISNVALCVDGKPVKLRVQVENDGTRTLYYKNGDRQVTYRSIKKNEK